MKNKFKYFVLFPLMILIVILTLTYDVKDLISLGVRIPFGASYWKDSLSDGISTNKSIYLGLGDSLKYNGVTVTSGTGGGGIAASDNINFTGRDTAKQNFVFADSMTALRYSRVDSLFTKNITPDDNKGLSWANTSSVKSTSGALYYTGGSHSFNTPYNTNVVSLDSINGLNLAYGNFTPASGNGLLWDATHKITYTSPTMTMRGNYWTFKTAVNNSTLLQLDSVIGMQLYSGVYIGNGSGLTSVDAITIKGQDTSKFARLDTNTTEKFSMRGLFTDIITFATTVTFTVSPVFSALVNFANGINVTGNATVSGYTTLGDVGTPIKTKIVKGVTPSTISTWGIYPHSLTGGRIVSVTTWVRADTTGWNITGSGAVNDITFPPRSGLTTAAQYDTYYDSLNVGLFLASTANAIKGDSVFFYITYTQ